jgi:hypothetical protein
MKKVIVLIGYFLSLSTHVYASEVIKMPVLDLLPTPLDYAVEIKTTKFDKVVLDCQSLRMGISFSENGTIKSDIYLNEENCNGIMEFLFESKEQDLPVCLGLDSENENLEISRQMSDCL